MVDLINGGPDTNAKLWDVIKAGYADAERCKDRAQLIDRTSLVDYVDRWELSSPTTEDRVSLRDFALALTCAVLQVSALLYEEHGITTANTVIIQGLCFVGGGKHFALRVQAAPRVQDMVQGDNPHDRFFFYDGLQIDGMLVEMEPEAWLKVRHLWLVHRVGDNLTAA